LLNAGAMPNSRQLKHKQLSMSCGIVV